MVCDRCKKEFTPGNREDGMPYGISFETPDGTKVTVCSDCLIEFGNYLKEKENRGRRLRHAN